MLVSRRPPLRRATRGFTLIELVVTIAILGILIGLALPSFRQFVATQRLRNASFDLMASLMRTRSEAITRNGQVSMTKATTGNWDGGWTVTDSTTTTPTNIQVQQAYSGIQITDSVGVSSVTFGKDGRAVSGTATNFTIAPSPAVTGVSSRCVTLNLSGMPSSSIGAC